MSRNSSGTYTAPSNSWNPAVEGTAIEESDWNSILTDVSNALTDSLDRTGKGKITAHIDFDENGSPGTPAANVGRVYVGDNGGVTTLYFKDASGNVYDLTQAATAGLAYTFNSTTTTSANPGSGKAAFNSAELASATEMAISTTTSGGGDVANFIAAWDDVGTTSRGNIIVQKRTDPSKIYIYTISGANTDATGYKRIALTYVSGSGAISNTDPLAISYTPPGPTGSTGPSGSMGGPGASVDGEIALYSGTGGSTLKRAATTGLLKATSGVLAAAASNTDYVAPTVAGYDALLSKGSDIASASTINLDTATGDLVDVTGTTAITAVTLSASRERTVRFTGVLTLTHGSSLVLPGAASITTAAGDYAVFRGYAAGVVRCVVYTKADGTPLVGGGSASAAVNRLLNGTGVVFQRALTGAQAATNGTYGFDRWYHLNQTAGVTLSQLTDVENGTPYMMRITQANAAAQRFGIAQCVESYNCKSLRGGSATLSARVRCSASTTLRYAILEWTGTADTLGDATTSRDPVNDWTSST